VWRQLSRYISHRLGARAVPFEFRAIAAARALVVQIIQYKLIIRGLQLKRTLNLALGAYFTAQVRLDTFVDFNLAYPGRHFDRVDRRRADSFTAEADN